MKKKKKQKSDFKAFLTDIRSLDRKLLVSFVVAFLLTLLLSQNSQGAVYGLSTALFENPMIRQEPMIVPKPALYPKKTTNVLPPQITAQSAIVIDVASQVVIHQKNEHVSFPLASTTKLMTALVGMEYFNLNDILTVPLISVAGAKMGLVDREQISFENLLYGLLLNSGNDAAEAIALASPPGYAGFIEVMNEKAKELHLANTHFEDPTGLSPENHTTALDLARLASFALKNAVLANVVSTQAKTVSDSTGQYTHALENLNKLLGTVEGVIGMKTGFTQEAGQVLVTAAARDNHTLVTVVLRSEDRFLDSKNLLEWAFANHSFTQASRL